MQTVRLYEKEIYEGCMDVSIECYIHKSSPELTATPRPAMIVFPGGGYTFTSDREAEPIASAYFSEGYNCFVVRYITGVRAQKNKPLFDAAAAIAYVRRYSSQYNIDSEKIAVIGFSAGGHLAGYIATCWHLPILSELLGEDNIMFRPNAAILSYPVITGFDYSHSDSFDNLLGSDRTEKETRAASLETLVSEKTVPCFIWHTAEDETVPVENSLLFAKALSAHSISYELHIFPKGKHGISRANRETTPDWSSGEYNRPYVARWIPWSVEWLENQLFSGSF
ncbi:MAG: alpha/beta hydrolase [Eubacteriales bacterium]|nr:alpha/beta hydrolase [Eubacteriales bacterium]MDD4421566.1 alpha/beta hydrolase [Eubacteriales bacterium]